MDYDTFMTKYEEDFPEATVKQAREEYRKTHGKQRGEEFEYCYWFCAILQERQLGITLQGAKC